MAHVFTELSRALRLAVLCAGVLGVGTSLFAWYQVMHERDADLEDVDRRAHTVAQQFAFNIQNLARLNDAQVQQQVGARLEGYGQLLGLAIYRLNGQAVALPKSLQDYTEPLAKHVARAVSTQHGISEVMTVHGLSLHVTVMPIELTGGSVEGYLAVLQDVSYIDGRATRRLITYGFWILVLTLMAVTVVIGASWFTYEVPMRNLADWMRSLRLQDAPLEPPLGLPTARLKSESDRLAASFRAARAAGVKQARESVAHERVWSKERLRADVLDNLGLDLNLVVVSNREPYMHQLVDGQAQAIKPAGGIVSALDPVLQACGGLWIAHGAGDADRESTDTHGRVTVPPQSPCYTLKRIWLSRAQEKGYYYGFSNEGLWPMCHLAYERPVFRASDWKHYHQVNQKFATAVLEELGDGNGLIFIQDYQLALVPEMIKAERPDLRVGIFWHIPWPNPETFRICPWATELLRGMLGADLIGFHLQQYGNNFLDTVDRMIEARLDWDHFGVDFKGHSSLVRPYPISVQSWSERHVPNDEVLAHNIAGIRKRLHIGDAQVILGVDRLDYTKGIPERLWALARFFEQHPEHHERVVFVQLGAPSRSNLRRYREYMAELEAQADEINARFQTDTWKPIRFLVGHHDEPTVYTYMRLANVCIVSSLHDGMNLVAKEYVAARPDEDGVLILSEFAGAARELSDALIVNPYDTEQFAATIRQAVEMDIGEQQVRMSYMNRQIQENNIYHWAGRILTDLAAARVTQPDSALASNQQDTAA